MRRNLLRGALACAVLAVSTLVLAEPVAATDTPKPGSLTLSWPTASNAPSGALVASWPAVAPTGTVYILDFRVKDTDGSTPGDQPGSWVQCIKEGAPVFNEFIRCKWRSLNITNPLKLDITRGITSGTVYEARVKTQRGRDSSDWTMSNALKPTGSPDAPDAPSLTATSGQLAASWSEPTTNGASISDYDVRYRIQDTNKSTPGNQPGAWSTLSGSDDPGTSTSATIAVTNGTAYQVQVQATNRFGTGPWSDSASGIFALAPDAPGAPTLAVADTALGVSWTVPANDGGVAVTDYDVQYRKCTYTADLTCSNNSTATWGSWTDRSGETASDTGTSVTLSSLTNGTAYQVQARAQNSVGESAWSASGQAVPADEPDAPGTPTLQHGSRNLAVSWSAPDDNGASISDYDVRYRKCTYAADLTCSNNSTATWGSWTDRSGETGADTGTTAALTGLTNGTAYQVQVRAENSVGESAWSGSASQYPSTVPGQPAAPAVTASDQTLAVSWTAPSSTGGSAVTGYVVGRCVSSTGCDAASEWTNVTLDSTGTSTSLTGLANGTAYRVRVAASNRDGAGAWSGTNTATPADKPDAPGAPTLTAGQRRLDVSWTEPADGGATISDYDVQYRACTYTADLTCSDSGTATWGTWQSHSHNGTGLSTIIGGLDYGTAYQVQVRAGNRIGESAWSAAAAASPTAQAPTAPSAPTVEGLVRSLSVSWTQSADNGASISDYDVQYRACTFADDLGCDDSGTATWGPWTARSGETAADTARSATIDSLAGGTAYQVQVRAANAVGESAWSASGSAKTVSQGTQQPGGTGTSPTGGGGSPRAELGAPERYWGPERHATAVAVADGYKAALRRSSPGTSVTTIIVASSANYPDALAGSALARHLSAPILLTGPDELHETVTRFLADNPSVTTAHLLGGTAALSETVEQQLRELVPAGRRIAGATRVETAAAIAAEVGKPGLWCNSFDSTVLLASGWSWTDAVIAGPASYWGRHPLLLTHSDTLPDAVRDYLQAAAPKRAIVIGDPTAISSVVVQALADMGISVTRITGDDPAGRAANLARATQVPSTVTGSTAGCLGATTVGLATSKLFPDALAAGPLLGQRRAPLLFTSADDGLPEATRAYVGSEAFKPNEASAPVIVIGGEAVVPQAHVTRIIRLAS